MLLVLQIKVKLKLHVRREYSSELRVKHLPIIIGRQIASHASHDADKGRDTTYPVDRKTFKSGLKQPYFDALVAQQLRCATSYIELTLDEYSRFLFRRKIALHRFFEEKSPSFTQTPSSSTVYSTPRKVSLGANCSASSARRSSSRSLTPSAPPTPNT
jgi:hypothetical protein